jgi:hypothetical protein
LTDQIVTHVRGIQARQDDYASASDSGTPDPTVEQKLRWNTGLCGFYRGMALDTRRCAP